MNYKQCTLQKGKENQVTWIPESFAKKGKYLELKNSQKNWENGWLIVAVGNTLDEQTLNERSQDYKRTRQASDI
jgi:hypothetical protein